MHKKRKEEEARIIAEMEAAMKENAEQKRAQEEEKTAPKTKAKVFGVFEDKTPETMHCHKCKTLMENGVCPNCGYKMYVPMDSEKQKKIRWIATGVCVVVFFLLLIVLEIVQ